MNSARSSKSIQRNCTRFSPALAQARTSIDRIWEMIDDSPHANTVKGHLIDQFDLDTAEVVGDTLLQRGAIETLLCRLVGVVTDLHFDTYYDNENETGALYFSQGT